MMFRWQMVVGLCLAAMLAWAQEEPKPAPAVPEVGRLSFDVVTPDQLRSSLALGTEFLLRQQLEAGNFRYEYDFLKPDEASVDDNAVRQAGVLWALASLHREKPDLRVAEAVYRGVEFWSRASVYHEASGGSYPVYPGQTTGKTGAVALLMLAIVEVLRQPEHLTPEMKAHYRVLLEQYQSFLLSLRTPEGLFASLYRADTGEPDGFPSPYSCGESLLALTKISRYLEQPELRPLVLASAATMHDTYVQQALAREPDSAITKGFFQWGLMSFHEIYTSDWEVPDRAEWGTRIVALGLWMVDGHKVLVRRANTGYAMEGLVVASDVARRLGRETEWVKLRLAIAVGMTRLTSWQVGGPLPNSFLRAHLTDDPLAIGGVMNSEDNPRLRADVTQHQMHAVSLVLQHVVPHLPDEARSRVDIPLTDLGAGRPPPADPQTAPAPPADATDD